MPAFRIVGGRAFALILNLTKATAMPAKKTTRVGILLPTRSPAQREAMALALVYLCQKYPDWTLAGAELDESNSGGTLAESLRPVMHGEWTNERKEKERDSHLLFLTHLDRIDDDERLRQTVEQLEVAMYAIYFAKAIHFRDANTYQKIVFVEAWSAVHAEQNLRHDLSVLVPRSP